MDEILAIGGRGLEVTPSGFDPVARTLRYVAATQNPCQSFRAGPDGEPMLVMEVLKADGCVNIASIAGTPLLNCHKREALTDILGRQNGGEVVGDTIVCTRQPIASRRRAGARLRLRGRRL